MILRLAIAALLAAPLPAASAARTAQAEAPPVIVPASRRIEITSSVNGRRYTAFVALPLTAAPPPPAGYPVLYVLDGNQLFGTAVDAARTFVHSGIVVVGIGYPFDDAALVSAASGLPASTPAEHRRAAGAAGELWRNHDLTLPATADFVRRRPGFGITVENVGGVDDFLETIERDIKRAVGAIVAIDPARQALFGHSFGGLAVVRALFTRPQSYRAFIAASPSIYWNDNAVLADEARFVARVRAGEVAPRILVTAGGDESTPAPGATAQAIEGLRLRRQVDNARELAARLAAVPGAPDYRVRGVVFEGEGHVSVQQAAISRGVRFAFGD